MMIEKSFARSWAILLIQLQVIACQCIAQDIDSPDAWPEFRRWVENSLADPRFQRAVWGVKITSLETGNTVFSHHEQKLLSPASNSKLYTVALVLDAFGPDYRIKTSLHAKAKPFRSGVLPGDLVVFGRGDPTFNAKLHGGDILSAFEPLVFALTNAGVKRVKGDLVADETFFRGSHFGSGWSWDDAQHAFGAEISALTANDNILELAVKPGAKTGEKVVPCEISISPPTSCLVISNRTVTVAAGGSRQIFVHRPEGGNVVYISGQMLVGEPVYREEVTVHAPAGLFLDLFRQALFRHGIRIDGKLRVIPGGAGLASPMETNKTLELAAVESPTLAEISRLVQKSSQNLYADLLFAHIGEVNGRNRATGFESSEDLGVKELRPFLSKAGIDRQDVFFEEGSGLSRNNLTTARATVALLVYASHQSWSNVFFEALPLAGVDGTLRNRLKAAPAARNVRAKTGSLRWAHSLSGTVTTGAGEKLAFCLMLNRFSPEPGEPGPDQELDAIASRLAAVSTRTR